MRPLGIALALLLAACQVPPFEEVVDGKPCDGDAGHGCAPGYQCCRGACLPPGQTCCIPEDDATFCTRLGRMCAGVSGDDNCGDPRTVNCGAETDAAFCARNGAQCGSYSGFDSCGVERFLDCGPCTVAPNLTCQGNACVCVPETDAQLCARLGGSCGDIRNTMDNCGVPRSVTCSCVAPKTCGGGGTAGQCGCLAVGTTCGSGTTCCAGACGGTAPAHCCLPLGDACTGISGECCQGTCGTITGTCCKGLSSGCTADAQCCTGFCDMVDHKCQ